MQLLHCFATRQLERKSFSKHIELRLFLLPIFPFSYKLQVEMATKERRMRALKEEVEGLASSLKEEGERVTSLKTQGIAVEEELETVLEVITQLCPHSQRSGRMGLDFVKV